MVLSANGDAFDLHMHGLGTQFQDDYTHYTTPGWPVGNCTNIPDIVGKTSSFDLDIGTKVPENVNAEAYPHDSNLLWDRTSRPRLRDAPVLSEGSSSHSSYDSAFSSVSTESYSPADLTTEAHKHIIYNEFARVDSAFPPELGSTPEFALRPNDCFVLHEDAMLNELLNFGHGLAHSPHSDQAELGNDMYFSSPLPIEEVPRSTPCPLVVMANPSASTSQSIPSHCEFVVANPAQAHTSTLAGDPDKPTCEISTNEGVERARPFFVGAQSIAQQDNVTTGSSSPSQSASSQDIHASSSDTDSYSDYEWSTETATSTNDIAQLRVTLIKPEDCKVYLRYLEAALKLVLGEYARWSLKGQRSRTGSSTQRSCQPSSATVAETEAAAKVTSKKRGRETRKKPSSQDEEDEEEEEEDLRRGKKVKTESADDHGLVFACPYFRLDPEKHAKCLARTLRRIRDVKQHLIRCHLRPHFCPVCGQVFETQAQQEVHVEERSCERPHAYSKPDGITQDHQKRLSSKSDRSLTPEEQWFRIWDIIFPEFQRPSLAYISGPFLEAIQECETFWYESGEATVSEWLATSGISQNEAIESSMALAMFLGCSRILFQLIRRRYARTASATAPPGSRLISRPGPSSRGGTTLVDGSSPSDVNEARSEPRGQAASEASSSQHNVAMADLGYRAPLPALRTDHEHLTIALTDITNIVEQGMPPPASLEEVESAGQLATMPEWAALSQEELDLGSFLSEYINMEGPEYAAPSAAIDARIGRLG